MLEYPEVITLAKQLQSTVTGKTVKRVLPPTKAHKFCWYNGEPADYDGILTGRKILGAEGFGIFAELSFEDGYRLCVNDGVNMRLLPEEKTPRNYQLAVWLDDGEVLAFTVAMYGGIILHKGDYENEYYEKSRQGISPLGPEFAGHFWKTMEESKPTLSAKAFLAAEQRFPGIGNGVLQDILFHAGIHPKKKLEEIKDEERTKLLECTVSTLREMTELGGRDTEKDIYGNPGGYKTKLSKNTWKAPCPVCGGPITKEAYMGGPVYYCPNCQPR